MYHWPIELDRELRPLNILDLASIYFFLKNECSAVLVDIDVICSFATHSLNLILDFNINFKGTCSRLVKFCYNFFLYQTLIIINL